MTILEIRAMNEDSEVEVLIDEETHRYVDVSRYDGMYCYGVFTASIFDKNADPEAIEEYTSQKAAFASDYGEYFKIAKKNLAALIG